MGIYDYVELLDEMRGVNTDDGDYDYDLPALDSWLFDQYGLDLESAQEFLSKLIHFVPTTEGGMGTLFKGFAKEANGTGRFLEKIKVDE